MVLTLHLARLFPPCLWFAGLCSIILHSVIFPSHHRISSFWPPPRFQVIFTLSLCPDSFTFSFSYHLYLFSTVTTHHLFIFSCWPFSTSISLSFPFVFICSPCSPVNITFAFSIFAIFFSLFISFCILSRLFFFSSKQWSVPLSGPKNKEEKCCFNTSFITVSHQHRPYSKISASWFSAQMKVNLHNVFW